MKTLLMLLVILSVQLGVNFSASTLAEANQNQNTFTQVHTILVQTPKTESKQSEITQVNEQQAEQKSTSTMNVAIIFATTVSVVVIYLLSRFFTQFVLSIFKNKD